MYSLSFNSTILRLFTRHVILMLTDNVGILSDSDHSTKLTGVIFCYASGYSKVIINIDFLNLKIGRP